MTSRRWYFPGANYPSDAWQILGKARFSDARRQRLEAAARNRTNHIRLVIQDVHTPHNVAACLRSAEAFGVLNVDIVNLREKFRHSGISRGVESWLRVRKTGSIPDLAKDLKSQGYKIYAAVPTATAKSIYELPIQSPLAVVFGNEHKGVSLEWEPVVDGYFTIPMLGLVESFNISVSCALALHELSLRGRSADPPLPNFLLDEAQVASLLNEWTCRQIVSWAGELESLRAKSQL